MLEAEDHYQQDAYLYQGTCRNAHQQTIHPEASLETQYVRHGQTHTVECNYICDRADILLACAPQNATGSTLNAVDHHKDGQKRNRAGGDCEDAGVGGERSGEVVTEKEDRRAC